MLEVLPPLYPLNQVGTALGVSIYTVRRFIAAGSLKAVRIGGRVMVSRAEVERAQTEGLCKPERRAMPKPITRVGRVRNG